MKKNVLTLFFLCFVLAIQAQDVTLNPGVLKVELKGDEGVEGKKFGFTLANATDTTFNWWWSVELPDNFPPEWDVQICDQQLCYNFGTLCNSPNKANELPAGFSTNPENQYVRIRSLENVSGASYVTMNVFSDGEKSNLILSSLDPAVNSEDLNFDDTRIFPNPAMDLFRVSNDEKIESIEVYNIIGKQVETFAHSEGQGHDISFLQSGLYIVRMLDKKGKTLKSQRLQKR